MKFTEISAKLGDGENVAGIDVIVEATDASGATHQLEVAGVRYERGNKQLVLETAPPAA